MLSDARDMKIQYWDILNARSPEQLEADLKSIITLYSNYMQACHDARETLTTGMNDLLGITE